MMQGNRMKTVDALQTNNSAVTPAKVGVQGERRCGALESRFRRCEEIQKDGLREIAQASCVLRDAPCGRSSG